jgi:prevent-host-death family protein
MHQVNIHEAKTQLSKLIQEALDGEEVIIARNSQPLVRLEVLQSAKKQRRIGGLKGVVVKVSEDFDAPLDDFSEYME